MYMHMVQYYNTSHEVILCFKHNCMTYMKTLIELEIEEELYYLHSPRKKEKNRNMSIAVATTYQATFTDKGRGQGQVAKKVASIER